MLASSTVSLIQGTELHHVKWHFPGSPDCFFVSDLLVRFSLLRFIGGRWCCEGSEYHSDSLGAANLDIAACSTDTIDASTVHSSLDINTTCHSFEKSGQIPSRTRFLGAHVHVDEYGAVTLIG